MTSPSFRWALPGRSSLSVHAPQMIPVVWRGTLCAPVLSRTGASVLSNAWEMAALFAF